MNSSAPSKKLSLTLWIVLILLFLSLFISYIDRGALSIAAPTLEREFSIPPSQLGILLSAFFWTYTPFLIFSGWLAENSQRSFRRHFTECRRFKNVIQTVILDLKASEDSMRIKMTGSYSDLYRGLFSTAA